MLWGFVVEGRERAGVCEGGSLGEGEGFYKSYCIQAVKDVTPQSYMYFQRTATDVLL